MNKIATIILLMFNVYYSLAQTPLENIDKYNYLRDRLRNDFTIVDATNRQGTNIPASKRNFWGGTLDYGQNPAISGISTYLMLLATEYAVNEKYNFDNTLILNELSYLLLAIERLDLNAEKFFRAEINNINTNSIDFWTEVDNYIDYDNDLNGFLLRIDVFGKHVNYPSGEQYYFDDEARYIYHYNNNQLLETEYFDGQITSCSNCFADGITNENRDIQSIDEISWTFLGLAMVAKLVDDDKLFIDTEGEKVTIRRWVAKITYRMMMALYNPDKSNKSNYFGWQLYNPVTESFLPDNNPNGGSNGTITYWMSAGFQMSAIYIISQDSSCLSDIMINQIQNMTNNKSFLIRKSLFKSVLNIDLSKKFDKLSDLIPLNLAFISGELASFQDVLHYMNNNTFCRSDTNIVFEFYPLIYSILHDVDMFQEWSTTYSNSVIPYFNYVDSIEMLLNVMPKCGSFFNKNAGIVSDYDWYRLRTSVPNKLHKKDFCQDDYINYGKIAIGSNIDYLILHNIYYLRLNNNLDIITNKPWVNSDYPTYRLVGSHANPFMVFGNYFNLNHTVFPDGDVTIVAQNYIELKPGFEVVDGGTFIAEIGIRDFDCDLNYPNIGYCDTKDKSDSLNVLFDSISNNFVSIQKNIDTIDSFPYYKIYPNPATDFIILEFQQNINIFSIKIVDFSGKIIYNTCNTSSNIKIDVSNFKNGVYILDIETEKQIFTEKIIKI